MEKIILPTGDYFEFDYDGRGLLQSITDPANRVTEFDMDSVGNLLKITNPDGSFKEFTYDQNHLLTQETTEAGKQNQFFYRKGRIIKEIITGGREIPITPSVLIGVIDVDKNINYKNIKAPIVKHSDIVAKAPTNGGDCLNLYTMHDIGTMKSFTDCLGHKSVYEISTRGQMTKNTTPENRTFESTYDDRGRATSNTDANGFTSYVYEQTFGRLARVTDESNLSINYTYNQMGLVTQTQDQLNNMTLFAYNEQGLLTATTDSLNNITSFTQDNFLNDNEITDPLGLKTTFIRDAAGNITKTIDPELNETNFVFDQMNRVTKIKDALDFETLFSYRADGKLTQLTNAKNQSTMFAYDPITQKLVQTTNPENQVETFFYDSNDRLIKKINKDATEIHFNYDLIGRLLAKTFTEDQINFGYDNDDLMVSAQNNSGLIQFTHDNKQRLKSVKPVHSTAKIIYEYGQVGRLSRIHTDDGKIDIRFFYDQRGLLVNQESILFGHELNYQRSYDVLGRLTTEVLPNNITTTRTYDNSSRLTSIDNKLSNNSSLSRFDYTYSDNGNITRIDKVIGGQTKKSIKTTNYGYDKLNRLTSASDEPQFVYDELGNQLQRNGQYNDLNQLLEDTENLYTYSINGNQLTKLNKQMQELTTISWDSENKITQIQVTKNQQTIKTINYAYDALGRRVTRIVQTQNYSYTRKYVYDGNKILMELNQDDEAVAVYLHGPGIDNPLAMLRDHNGDGEFSSGEVFVFTKDHLNSVREISDHDQKLIQRYNYSAYGKTKLERISGGADIRFVENYFTYTSRELELETGMVCHLNRCEESNGRWMSEDSIGFAGGDGNLYNAFRNNPLIYTDPFGLREPEVSSGGSWGDIILGGTVLAAAYSVRQCNKENNEKKSEKKKVEESTNKQKEKCLNQKANLEQVCSDPDQKYRAYCTQPPIVCN